MRSKKPIIGLCGGIGAGKSTVAAEFGRLGCAIIDADRLNHQVLARPEVVERLRQWWGDKVVGPGGEPDRAKIAEIVFSSPQEKGRLESLVHPLIAKERWDIINRAGEDQAVKAIILDSPLLFEVNLDRTCDAIVFVEADRQERLRRLKQTRGWDEAEVDRRERWHLALEQKRARADYLIDNGGPPDRLRAQVASVLEKILARFAG